MPQNATKQGGTTVPALKMGKRRGHGAEVLSRPCPRPPPAARTELGAAVWGLISSHHPKCPTVSQLAKAGTVLSMAIFNICLLKASAKLGNSLQEITDEKSSTGASPQKVYRPQPPPWGSEGSLMTMAPCLGVVERHWHPLALNLLIPMSGAIVKAKPIAQSSCSMGTRSGDAQMAATSLPTPGWDT